MEYLVGGVVGGAVVIGAIVAVRIWRNRSHRAMLGRVEALLDTQRLEEAAKEARRLLDQAEEDWKQRNEHVEAHLMRAERILRSTLFEHHVQLQAVLEGPVPWSSGVETVLLFRLDAEREAAIALARVIAFYRSAFFVHKGVDELGLRSQDEAIRRALARIPGLAKNGPSEFVVYNGLVEHLERLAVFGATAQEFADAFHVAAQALAIEVSEIGDEHPLPDLSAHLLRYFEKTRDVIESSAALRTMQRAMRLAEEGRM